MKQSVKSLLLFAACCAFTGRADAQMLQGQKQATHNHSHGTAVAQPKKPVIDPKEMYPAAYSFDKAREFEKAGAAEKAMWYYINLYPGNEKKVLESVLAMGKSLKIASLSDLIRVTFSTYAQKDPGISYKSPDGYLNVDYNKLMVRGQQAEALMMQLGNR